MELEDNVWNHGNLGKVQYRFMECSDRLKGRHATIALFDKMEGEIIEGSNRHFL
jgi:hypothetical protein